MWGSSVGLQVFLAGVIATALIRPVTVETEAPIGRISVEDVFVHKSIVDEMGEEKGTPTKTFALTCSTASQAGRTVMEHVKLGVRNGFEEPLDAKVDLLSFEEMECELRETLTSSEQQILSHGLCLYSYRRFLQSEDNSVECQLLGGSSFRLKMTCDGGCPRAPEPRGEPYCSGTMMVPPASYGLMNSFGDGSPGFALYGPDSKCAWKIPRSSKGVTNFLFTRFDLAKGDKVLVYESIDGTSRNLIKTYKEHSFPESVSTDAPFMIIEFVSDGGEEGLGFYGFYYDTFEKHGPVSILPGSEDPEISVVVENKEGGKVNVLPPSVGTIEPLTPLVDSTSSTGNKKGRKVG
ncbi:hypothetical protein BSKO_13389 [Bryopsis sp. KO-2023]|nr:hypothetical protein BSKO_13389 [Bryopsis sp. KO-2023]